MDLTLAQNDELFRDVKRIIDEARQKVASAANSALTLMYWEIGQRINVDVLKGERAEYGKQIVSALSTQLQQEFGTKEFSKRSLHRMMQFASTYPNIEIVSTVLTQLPWSAFLQLLPIKDELQREFYLTMAISNRWSVRTLRKQIDGMLFERTAISGKSNEEIRKELALLREEKQMSPDLVFKSPYFLDFTGLKGYYSEKSLEDMLITGLQKFLIELGDGFCFVDRQKRMIIDGEDFKLDLLFFHRKLKRLIAIDLKRTRFKAAYKGQMELYLRWLDKYERCEGEASPLGLILCTEGSDEQIELLQLEQSGIKVAKYYTELPNRKLLQNELRKQLELARQRLENCSVEEEE